MKPTTDADLRRDITARLRKGQRRDKIARQYGMSWRSLSKEMKRLDLIDPPHDQIFVADVCRALELSNSPCRMLLKREGVHLFRWGAQRCISLAAFDRLLDARPVTTVEEAPEGHYTAKEIAERNGLNVQSFRTRLCRDRVRPVCFLKTPRMFRPTALYTLRQVDAYLPRPSHPVTVPHGYLTSKEVSEVLGVSPSAVRKWVWDGAPAVLLAAGERSYSFHPVKLGEWMEAKLNRSDAKRRGRQLQAYGQQGKAA